MRRDSSDQLEVGVVEFGVLGHINPVAASECVFKKGQQGTFKQVI
jgi:hypothetical protein